jgi:hypothetical protein
LHEYLPSPAGFDLRSPGSKTRADILPTGSKLANLLATRAENGRRRLEEIFPCIVEGGEPRLGEIGNPCFPCDGEIQPVGEYGNEFPCGESARATIVVDQCIFDNLSCVPNSYFGPLIVSGQTDVTVQQTIFRDNNLSACSASSAQVRIARLCFFFFAESHGSRL